MEKRSNVSQFVDSNLFNLHYACMSCSTARSKILQTLIGRMAGKPGHAELFTSALARAGEHGVTSLVEHADGSSVLMKCLDTFSAEQNRVQPDFESLALTATYIMAIIN